MEREIFVFTDLAGESLPVGRLWARTRGAKETVSFEYDPSWLARRDTFGLDPLLPLARGQFHSDRPLFNAFTDPAPDRWGQTLMRRNEHRRARVESRQPRTLLAVDFLILVDDETRLGALRFKDAAVATSSPRPASAFHLSSTSPVCCRQPTASSTTRRPTKTCN